MNGDVMDPFFNEEYANEVTEYISKMDDDTAQMFSLMTVHDILHQDIENNRKTISKRVFEILSNIEDAAQGYYDEDPAVAVFSTEVSKAGERKVQTPEGAAYFNQPVGSVIRARSQPKNYKVKVKGDKINVKYKGPKDNFNPRANDFDVVSALSGANNRASSFEQQWNQGVDPRSSSQRTYNRVSSGSRLVRDVGLATGSPSVATAGAVGEFAGHFGPSAERVVGPSMRRTAYRYRGTEEKLDPEVGRAIRQEVSNAMRDQGPSKTPLSAAQVRGVNQRAQQARKADPSKSLSEHRKEIYQQTARNQPSVRTPLTPEQRTEIARAVVIQNLTNKLPSSELSALQIASGKVPPSRGIIINAQGHPVAQAVGYQEDHFLPFNLKNLKSLQGGSYVRTRSSGGLTSEDIYTGIMSGARSITVVSRSGEFTIDFADDFRGTRRYGDVARQMVNRYEKTLDAVQSRQVERSPLSQMEKAQIRNDIEREYDSYRGTQEGRKMIEDLIKEEIDAAKRSTEPTLRELEQIENVVRSEINKPNFRSMWAGTKGAAPLPDDPEVAASIVRQELIDDLRADKVTRMHQLDGMGYETALKAMQEQYPQMIANVRANTTKGPANAPRSRETDQGYVRRNYLRPKAVREGYFDPEIEGYEGSDGTGKYSAASTNYQNFANRMNRSEEEPTSTTGTTGGSTGEGDASSSPSPDRPKPPPNMSDTATRAKALMEVEDAYVDLINEVMIAGAGKSDMRKHMGGAAPGTAEATRNLRRAMSNPKVQEDVEAVVNDAIAQYKESNNDTQARDLTNKLQAIRDKQTDIETRKSDRLGEGYSSSPRVPATFDEIPSGKGLDYYEKRMSGLSTVSTINPPTSTDGRYSEDEDNTLRNQSDTSLALAAMYERIADKGPEDDDLVTVYRSIRDDDGIKGQEEQAFKMVGGDKARAEERAKYHRTRSREIEMYRRLRTEWTKDLQKTTNARKN